MPFNAARQETEFIEHAGLGFSRALKFSMQCQGNGVDRLLFASLVPADEAILESKLCDRRPLAFPYSDRFIDLACEALTALGIDPRHVLPLNLQASVRAIDERTLEVIAWRCAGGSEGI